MSLLSLALVCLICHSLSTTKVTLNNPVPLVDTEGRQMDAHDGDIHQFEGSFYYYAMSYTRCKFYGCWTPDCGHRTDHRINVWKSDTLERGSWSLIGEALPLSVSRQYSPCVCLFFQSVILTLQPLQTRPNGTYFRPHLQYNKNTKRYVLIVNFFPVNGVDEHGAVCNAPGDNATGTCAPSPAPCLAAGCRRTHDYVNLVAVADKPEGPFTYPQPITGLAWSVAGNPWNSSYTFGDFGFFADSQSGAAYLSYVVGGVPGLHWQSSTCFVIEKLNSSYTGGTGVASGCLNAAPPQGNETGTPKAISHMQESPTMYRAPSGEFVVLGAGSTCFGLAQPQGANWSVDPRAVCTDSSIVNNRTYSCTMCNNCGGPDRVCPHSQCTVCIDHCHSWGGTGM